MCWRGKLAGQVRVVKIIMSNTFRIVHDTLRIEPPFMPAIVPFSIYGNVVFVVLNTANMACSLFLAGLIICGAIYLSQYLNQTSLPVLYIICVGFVFLVPVFIVFHKLMFPINFVCINIKNKKINTVHVRSVLDFTRKSVEFNLVEIVFASAKVDWRGSLWKKKDSLSGLSVCGIRFDNDNFVLLGIHRARGKMQDRLEGALGDICSVEEDSATWKFRGG